MNCRHCGDVLPSDCPATVNSCKGYCDWLALKRGDKLTTAEADVLTLYAGLCAFHVSIQRGIEVFLELD
jgi:hypothetical protein